MFCLRLISLAEFAWYDVSLESPFDSHMEVSIHLILSSARLSWYDCPCLRARYARLFGPARGETYRPNSYDSLVLIFVGGYARSSDPLFERVKFVRSPLFSF